MGEDYQSLSITFRIAPSTISLIVSEVCQLIIDVLGPIFIKVPMNRTEWINVAEMFDLNCNFRHCIGAIDCKHIRIEKPKRSGSLYFNRKGVFSIQLLTLVDSEYRIRYLVIGKEGSRHDRLERM